MKKILILNIAALIFASSAFAGASKDIATTYADAGKTVYGAKASATVGNAGTKSLGKLSTGVDVAWRTATNGYAVETAHKSGNKAYGSSHDSTAIFMKDITTGSGVTAPSVVGSTDFVTSTNNWKSM